MGWPSSRAIRRAAFLDCQTPRENYGDAVTLVGYRSTDRRLEDVTVYIQKYMGVNWGTDGYGYVRHNYMLKHLYGAFVMESSRSLTRTSSAEQAGPGKNRRYASGCSNHSALLGLLPEKAFSKPRFGSVLSSSGALRLLFHRSSVTIGWAPDDWGRQADWVGWGDTRSVLTPPRFGRRSPVVT